MIFDPDGSINLERSSTFVKRRLRKLALQPLNGHLVDTAIKEVLQVTISPDIVHLACKHLEETALSQTGLIESKIPLSRVGDRSLEWTFFQNRRESLPDTPTGYVSKHAEFSSLVLQAILRAMNSLQFGGMSETYRLFMRYKSVSSALRKMRAKQIRSWEVGDYLAFAICPPSFHELEDIVTCIDDEFVNDVLYKQNGFVDRVVYRRELPGFPGRRVFYIIRFNDVVCFEIQVVTLRQLIFLHLDHSRYVGRPHTANQLKSLRMFGDSAYLLDLLDLSKELKASVVEDT
jgi:hypothetical protein